MKRRLKRISSIASFFLLAGSVQAASTTDVMFTVGDSISAAFIASTHIGDVQNKTISSFNAIHDLPSLISFGQILNEKETYSWASGSNINSHYIRLKENLELGDPNAKLAVENFAISGARASDLPQELEQLLTVWKSGKYRTIKYMTLLIGANDSCDEAGGDSTQPSLLAQNLKNFFAGVATIQQSEPIRILVSAIPKTPDVANPLIFDLHTLPGVTCRDMELKVTNFCDGLLNWSTPAEYASRVQQVINDNATIQKVVEQANQQYPQLKVVYTEVLYQYPIQAESLAVDCFHPNRLGQAKISEILWAAQPWFH